MISYCFRTDIRCSGNWLCAKVFACLRALQETEIWKICLRCDYWLIDKRKLKTTCAPKFNTSCPRSLLGDACWSRQGRLPRGEELPAAKSTLGAGRKLSRTWSSPFAPDHFLFQSSHIFSNVFAFCTHTNFSVGERRARRDKGLMSKTRLAKSHNGHF